MQNIRAIKRFGQNYIVDPNIINKFVDTAGISKDDVVIEIGPGKGAITQELFIRTHNVTAIDIDTRIIEPLREMLPEIKVLHKDILTVDFCNLADGNTIKVIGNIPFNLTSPILFKLIEFQSCISDVVFIVQNEVAKRIIAPKGTKEYGILSVILNHVAETKLCFKISRNAFSPRPKVDSAVLHLKFKHSGDIEVDTNMFIKVVKASFGNRRKTLKNSLSNSIFNTCDFSKIKTDLSQRAEKLSVSEFIELTKQIQQAYD